MMIDQFAILEFQLGPDSNDEKVWTTVFWTGKLHFALTQLPPKSMIFANNFINSYYYCVPIGSCCRWCSL